MSFLEHLRLLRPDWRDAIEIAIVAFALYRVMLLFHGTRAAGSFTPLISPMKRLREAPNSTG